MQVSLPRKSSFGSRAGRRLSQAGAVFTAFLAKFQFISSRRYPYQTLSLWRAQSLFSASLPISRSPLVERSGVSLIYLTIRGACSFTSFFEYSKWTIHKADNEMKKSCDSPNECYHDSLKWYRHNFTESLSISVTIHKINKRGYLEGISTNI